MVMCSQKLFIPQYYKLGNNMGEYLPPINLNRLFINYYNNSHYNYYLALTLSYLFVYNQMYQPSTRFQNGGHMLQ